MKERLRHLGPLAGLLALIAFPGSALAATGSQTFTKAGENVFVVPAGVTGVQVTLVGGNGGPGFASGTSIPGGGGATALATIAVTPGESLYTEVAGDGGAGQQFVAGAAGIGGGGRGGMDNANDIGAGGGGGASDVRTCSVHVCTTQAAAFGSRLVVAAGGGGGGDQSPYGPALGGSGGDAGGAGTAGAATDAFEGGGGGQAGGQTAGGKGGTNGSGGRAPSGQLGVGGNGADGNVLASAFGGGGGGGLYGGGGGGLGEYGVVSNLPESGAGGGGGGGSSGVPAGAPGVSGFGTDPTPDAAEPQITFSWTLPPPAAVTGPPTGTSATSATLTGTVNPDGSVVSDCHFVVSGAGTIPCLQQVGAGSTPVAVTAALTGLSPGHSYTVTLVAASAQGTSTGAPVSFTTPSSGPPVVSNLRVTPKKFRRGSAKAVLSRKRKKTPRATAISFQLSEAASVKLTFAKQIKGHKAGKRCIAKRNQHGRRCTTFKSTSAAISRAAHAGTDTLTFAGVPDTGKRLGSGTYRLSITATDAAGKSSHTLSAKFTIVR